MKLERIIHSLDAVVITKFMSDGDEIEWACATDLMSEVLYYSKDSSVLITGLTKQQAIRTADIADIRVVVFTRGKEPDTPTIELANEKRITLLITPYSMFTACGRLYEAGLRCCPE
jgi:predicted transcriptional regulator